MSKQLKNSVETVSIRELLSALKAIHTTVRGDEKSECWTIRAWLNARGIFNDDLQGSERLIEAACVFAIASRPDECLK